jgi:hypothetical protein
MTRAPRHGDQLRTGLCAWQPISTNMTDKMKSPVNMPCLQSARTVNRQQGRAPLARRYAAGGGDLAFVVDAVMSAAGAAAAPSPDRRRAAPPGAGAWV